MKIIENSIHFKSYPKFYRRELHGGKHNTSRVVTDAEIRKYGLRLEEMQYSTILYSMGTKIEYIVMHCGDYCFNRRLADVSEWNGSWIFSWWPEDVKYSMNITESHK